MEKVYAIITDSEVTNTVISENAEILSMFFPNAHAVVEVTEKTKAASTGYLYQEGTFYTPKPYESWTMDKSIKSWKPPKKMPTLNKGQYATWVEQDKDWLVGTIPQEEA